MSSPQKKLIFCVTRAHNITLSIPFYLLININNSYTIKTCLRDPSPYLFFNGIDEAREDIITKCMNSSIKLSANGTYVPQARVSNQGSKMTKKSSNDNLDTIDNKNESENAIIPQTNRYSNFYSNNNNNYNASFNSTRMFKSQYNTPNLFKNPSFSSSFNTSFNASSMFKKFKRNTVTEEKLTTISEEMRIQLEKENQRKPIEFPRIFYTYDLKGDSANSNDASFSNDARKIPITISVFTMHDEFVVSSSGMLDLNSFLNMNVLKSEEENVDTKSYQIVNLRFQLSALNSMFVDIAFTIYDESVHMKEYEQIQKLVLQNDIEGVKFLFEGKTASGYTSDTGFADLVPNAYLKDYILENIMEGNQTLLHIACEKGYTKMVQYFLQNIFPNEINLVIYNSNMETPFHVACRKKQITLMNYLINNKFQLLDPSLQLLQRNHTVFLITRNPKTRPDTQAASTQKQETITQKHLDYHLQTFQKIKIFSSQNQMPKEKYLSPFHDACAKDDEKILKILLQYLQSNEMFSSIMKDIMLECLIICSYMGSIRCLSILMQFQADINISLSTIDQECYSYAVPLYYACVFNQSKIIMRLLERGAKIPYEFKPTLQDRIRNPKLIKKALPLLLCILVDSIAPEVIIDMYRINFKLQLKSNVIDLLFLSALYCPPLFEEILTEKGMDWKSKSNFNDYLIHYMAQFATKEQILYLESKGIFSDKTYINSINRDGETALHVAAKYGNIDAILALTNAKAKINVLDNLKCAPIVTAIEYAQPYATQTLFEIQKKNLSIIPEEYHLYFSILVGDKSLALNLLKDENLDPTSCITSGPCLYYCAQPLNPNMDTVSISTVQNSIARVLIFKNFKSTFKTGNLITLSFQNKRDDMAKIFISQGFSPADTILALYRSPEQRNNFVRCINMLLQTGTSGLNVFDSQERGILHYLAEKKDDEILSLLGPHTKNLPSLIGKDEQGRTPLHILCRSSIRAKPEVDKSIALTLFQLGDKPFILDKNGHTAFYYALVNRNYQICEVFMAILGFDCVLKPFTGKVLYSPVSSKSILRELLDSKTRDMNSLIDAIEFFAFYKVNILSVGFDITQYCLQSKDILRLFMSSNVEVLKKRDENGDNCVHQLFNNSFPLRKEILQLLYNGDLLGELLNQKNLNGETPFLRCFMSLFLKQCLLDILEICSENTLSFSGVDEEGNTELHLAVLTGDIEILEALFKKNRKSLDINKINQKTKENALELLLNQSYDNYESLISVLLKNGICVTPKALKLAKEKGLQELFWNYRSYWDISNLIREGKQLQAQNNVKAGGEISTFEFNDRGFCAIHEAVYSKFNALLQKDETLQCLIDAGCNVNEKTQEGETALHIAAKLGVVEVVKTLARQSKCEVNITNNEGYTVLQSILINHSSNNLNRTVQVLLDYGADINVIDDKGRTVLHLFCFENTNTQDTTPVTTLAKKLRTLLNSQDSDGNTPLHYAAKSENFDLVKKLISSSFTNIYIRNKARILPEDVTNNKKIREVILSRYLQGYLLKKAPTGVVRLSKRRWFVIQPDYLRYYTTEELKETKGEIAIKDIIAVKEVDGVSFKFDIITNQARKYELQAENKQMYKKWMKTLNLRVEANKK